MTETTSTGTIEAPTEDRLYTVAQVMEMLDYDSRQGVYYLIDKGRLAAEKFPGNRLRIRESALARYKEQYLIPEALPLPEKAEVCS